MQATLIKCSGAPKIVGRMSFWEEERVEVEGEDLRVDRGWGYNNIAFHVYVGN